MLELGEGREGKSNLNIVMIVNTVGIYGSSLFEYIYIYFFFIRNHEIVSLLSFVSSSEIN